MSIYQFGVQKRDMEGSWSSKGERQYTVVLQCLSNDIKDDCVSVLNDVCNHLGIPVGTPAYVAYSFGNSFDPLAMLKKITVRQTASGAKGESREWTARLEYDSAAEQMQDNPLLRPTIINGNFQEYAKVLWKDINGKAITNTAKYRFDPPIEIPDARPVVTFTRNEITYDIAYFSNNFVNRINSSPWYGGAVNQWRCANVSGTGPHVENNVVFFTVTYDFQFRYEGWKPQVANAGLYDINQKPVVDNYGNNVTVPAPLNPDGTQVFGKIIDSDWNFITVEGFYSADFNALGLP